MRTDLPVTQTNQFDFSDVARCCEPGSLQNHARQNAIFASSFKLIWAVQPFTQKYFCFRKSEIVTF